MVKELVSKAEFARMAGVTAAAITKAMKNRITCAVEGTRIDAAHPDAAAYLKEKTNQPTEAATGIDPLYEQAVAHCGNSGRYTASSIQRGLKIGYNRACHILATMKGAGMIPGEDNTTDVEPKPVKPIKQKAVAPPPPITDPEDMLHSIPEDIREFADMSLRDLVHRFGTTTAFKDWLAATKMIEDINKKRLENAKTQGELVSRYLVKIGIIEPIDAAHIKLLTDGAKTIARRVTAMTAAGKSVEDCEKFVADQITSFIRPVKAKVARALKNA
jgi:hypothetical protein